MVLAHAKIGDSGAQEVAEFASGSVFLRLLDLTGCEISSTGLLHLAEALRRRFLEGLRDPFWRRSITLESLVLRHNPLTTGPLNED